VTDNDDNGDGGSSKDDVRRRKMGERGDDGGVLGDGGGGGGAGAAPSSLEQLSLFIMASRYVKGAIPSKQEVRSCSNFHSKKWVQFLMDLVQPITAETDI
jgi:hypothetical protein